MPAQTRTCGSDQSQEPGTLLVSPLWMAKTQILEPSSDTSQDHSYIEAILKVRTQIYTVK